MNSKQRRKDRRRWRYSVRLTTSDVMIKEYNQMWDWCRDTFGNGRRCAGWREKFGHFGTCWQFTSDKKAALFALRWC